ncbi:MAG: polysaccharide export protein [Alphaproteobacteria bacterium]
MSTIWRFIIIFQLVALAGCVADEQLQVVPYNNVHEYRLGSGDQIRVTVYNQPTLSANYTVSASGMVSLPLAGTFKASNKTTRQIESAIVSSLKEKGLIDDPKVSVEVAVYRPFSVLGEVRASGRFPYSPGMTVEDAIALAGGYTIHADKETIRVTSRVGNKQVPQNRPPTANVSPGDVIFVKERWY